jgi:hypothetical protein
MAKVTIECNQQGFQRAVYGIAKATKTNARTVLKKEVGAILKKTVEYVRVAKASKIRETWQGYKYWLDYGISSNGQTGTLRTRKNEKLFRGQQGVAKLDVTIMSPSGSLRNKGSSGWGDNDFAYDIRANKWYKMTWLMDNKLWARIKSTMALRSERSKWFTEQMQARLGAVFLAAQSWYRIGLKTGLLQSTDVNPKIAAAVSSGRFKHYDSSGGVVEFSKLFSYGFQIRFHDDRLIQKANASKAFWWARNTRIKYFQQNLRHGVFKDIAEAKKRYKL